MNAQCIALAILSVGVACGQVSQALPAGMPAPDGAQAIIGESAARFVFPAEAAPHLTWDVPRAGAYPGRSEFAWEVRWDIEAPAQPGIAPHGLALITEWRTGGPHYGAIDELLVAFAPRVMTECRQCGTLASIHAVDSAFTAKASAGRVVFTVTGVKAVARIFPVVPDSVRFQRQLGIGARIEQITVAVERRNP